MTFQIIRNDITKVKADIIVNTANPIYDQIKENTLATNNKIGLKLKSRNTIKSESCFFYSSILQLFTAYSRKIPISSLRLCPVWQEIESMLSTISSFILMENVLYPSFPRIFLGLIMSLSSDILSPLFIFCLTYIIMLKMDEKYVIFYVIKLC